MSQRYFLSTLLIAVVLMFCQRVGAVTGGFDASLQMTGAQCINVSGLPIASIPAVIEMNRFDCTSLTADIGAPIVISVTGVANSEVVNGEVDESLSLTSVTCINVTGFGLEGTSAVAVLNGQTFQCSPLIQPGNRIAITVAGTTLSGSGDCPIVEDVETMDPVQVPVITFNGAPGECATIIGTITNGYDDIANPDPNQDGDPYILLFPFAGSLTQAEVSMSITADPPTTMVYGLLDDSNNVLVDCTLTPDLCQVSLSVRGAILAIFAQDPTSYILQITVSASGGRRVSGVASPSADGAELDRLRTSVPPDLLNAIYEEMR